MANMDTERNQVRLTVVAVAALVGLLLLPFFYVLSCGPAYWLHEHGHLSYEVYSACYRPLAQLSQVCQPFNVLLQWYLSLFAG